MFIKEALPFVNEFTQKLDEGLEEYEPGKGLSRIQRLWITFCLMGIIMTNSVCFAKFERASLGEYSLAALSWMLRFSKIPWTRLLQMSVKMVLRRYGITHGVLVVDDSDRKRSKRTKRIFKTYKLKDKTTGGYVNGQTIVFLVLVTPEITVPVGFSFYMPDPAQTAWNQEEKRLKKQGIPKKKRPKKPAKNPAYPDKKELALRLACQFRSLYPQIVIKAFLGDGLYATDSFMEAVGKLFHCQVISQICNNQNVLFRNKTLSVSEYFRIHPGVSQRVKIRGGNEINVTVGSARLYVTAHNRKCFVIALKYEGEEQYRYLIASDMSWRTLDIVQCYSLRWLVEVFIEDWKGFEGWGQKALQFDEEGSSRSLILSLLVDHCLLFHPLQLARFEDKLPMYTVGSLQERTRMEGLLEFIRSLLLQEDPKEALTQLSRVVEEFFQLRISQKHMIGRDLGRLEPTPALKYRAMQACATQ